MRSSHPMHVHLYRLTEDKALPHLATILGQLARKPLEDRICKIGYQEFRLDAVLQPDRHWPTWRLSICKFRSEGPGRAKRDTPSQGIDLDEDEEFTEDTALLFDPASKMMVAQYNHHGPRSGSIIDYLNAWTGIDTAIYTMAPQLNPNVQARLRSKKQFTRVAFKVAPAMITDAWKRNNVAMTTMLEDQANAWDCEWITVVVSLDARNPQATLSVRDKLRSLVGLSHESRDAVKVLKVSGRDEAGMRIDPIDLLAERLERTYNGLPLNRRRVALDDRWKALHDAFDHWQRDGIIR